MASDTGKQQTAVLGLPCGAEVERIARIIAYWHGAKMVVHDREEGTLTVAARAGYGKWGYSPSNYAEGHWQEYIQAAEAVIADREHIAAVAAEKVIAGWITDREPYEPDR